MLCVRAPCRHRHEEFQASVLVGAGSRVPARGENSPQDPIRAEGRAEVHGSVSVPVNARESTDYGGYVGRPPFTLSPRTRWQRTEFAAIWFFRALDATPFTRERETG